MRDLNALTLAFILLHSFLLRAEEKSYSIEIRDAPIEDVVRLFARMQGKNIVLPSKLEELVTASFSATDLEAALSSILESRNLGAVVNKNIVRVSTKREMETLGHDLRTTIFRLKY
jgi:type II secretory pathway component GspD/PulD (secretin)